MRPFSRVVLQIEPQIYRGNCGEFALQAGTLVLWRQSECATFGVAPMRNAANYMEGIMCQDAERGQGIPPRGFGFRILEAKVSAQADPEAWSRVVSQA
jgi:hypothetical protein